MTNLSYKIFYSNSPSAQEALQDLLLQIDSIALLPIRLVFFCNAKTNEEYIVLRNRIEALCRQHYSAPEPVVALVAQAPLDAMLAVEVTYTNLAETKIIRHENYTMLDNKILLSGAIYTSLDDSIAEQSDKIFTSIAEILQKEGYKIDNIVRQWNFIEKITQLSPEGQNYQQFNDSRSRFYAQTNWANGYPAATGIGTACAGVVVIIDALRDSCTHSTPIDNPLQISAHAYSQRVLIDNNPTSSKSTPKFERARRVNSECSSMIYISGTAAIRGEDSCSQCNITEQIKLTMENIDCLISRDSSPLEAKQNADKFEKKMLRIYLKHRSNWPIVKSWIAENCAHIETLCVEADICRSELLVEIEGIANKIIKNR